MRYLDAEKMEIEKGDYILITFNSYGTTKETRTLETNFVFINQKGICYLENKKPIFKMWSRIKGLEKVVK